MNLNKFAMNKFRGHIYSLLIKIKPNIITYEEIY